MRQTDQNAVGSFFSINSTYMYMDLCNIIQLALDVKWIVVGNEANDMDVLQMKMLLSIKKQCIGNY